jgi:RNA polymerase primary sigma factor
MAQDIGLSYYFSQLGKIPILTPEEEKKITLQAYKGNKKAKERLISANLRLVVKIAHEFSNQGLPMADLIEEGNLGLMYSVDKFKPQKGFRFSTYARWWILNYIRRAIKNAINPIKLPVSLIDIITKCKKTSAKLSHKLGREPYYDEILKELNPSSQFMSMFKKALRFEYSARRDLFPNVISGEIDMFLSERPLPVEEQSLDNTDKKMIQTFLSNISEKEAQVLNLRYGLEDNKPPLNLRQIAKKLKLSPEGVRFIENKALKKLSDIYWQKSPSA